MVVLGGGRFLMSEVPLYLQRGAAVEGRRVERACRQQRQQERHLLCTSGFGARGWKVEFGGLGSGVLGSSI